MESVAPGVEGVPTCRGPSQSQRKKETTFQPNHIRRVQFFARRDSNRRGFFQPGTIAGDIPMHDTDGTHSRNCFLSHLGTEHVALGEQWRTSLLLGGIFDQFIIHGQPSSVSDCDWRSESTYSWWRKTWKNCGKDEANIWRVGQNTPVDPFYED